MQLYRFLSRRFPDSYLAKVFAVVAAGFLVPVIGAAAYLAGGAGTVDPVLAAVLLASGSAGLVLVLVALRALLAPILMVSGVMDRWGRTGQLRILPEGYEDEVGLLMTRTNRMMARAQRSLDQSRREVDTDPLTGALNRRGAERLLRDGPAGWLLLLDLDRFGQLRDLHGTSEADRVLREVVQVAANVLRHDDVLARHDDGEFLLFLPGAPQKVALRVADRLRQEIATGVKLRGLTLTASVGLAAHPGGGEIDPSLRATEAALRDARSSGGDTVILSDAEGRRAA